MPNALTTFTTTVGSLTTKIGEAAKPIGTWMWNSAYHIVMVKIPHGFHSGMHKGGVLFVGFKRLVVSASILGANAIQTSAKAVMAHSKNLFFAVPRDFRLVIGGFIAGAATLKVAQWYLGQKTPQNKLPSPSLTESPIPQKSLTPPTKPDASATPPPVPKNDPNDNGEGLGPMNSQATSSILSSNPSGSLDSSCEDEEVPANSSSPRSDTPNPELELNDKSEESVEAVVVLSLNPSEPEKTETSFSSTLSDVTGNPLLSKDTPAITITPLSQTSSSSPRLVPSSIPERPLSPTDDDGKEEKQSV